MNIDYYNRPLLNGGGKMGITDLFKENDSKRDYAQEFKDAFESRDGEKVFEVMGKWQNDDSDDANFTLAMVIMGSFSQAIEFTKTFELYLSSADEKPTNPALHDWFNTTAINLMEKRVDEDIGFSEMFNNRYKNSTPSNDYANDFLNLFDEILQNNDSSELNRLHELISEWEESYPEDANMHCAYIILNVLNLPDDELKIRIEKAKKNLPINKNAYAKFLALMQMVCEKNSEEVI